MHKDEHTWKICVWTACPCLRSVHLCLAKPPQHIQSSEITPAPSVCPRTHACCTRQDMNICRSPALHRSSCTLWATAGGNWRWRTGKSIGPGFKTNGICGQGESRAHCRSYFTLNPKTFTISPRGKTHTHARTCVRTHTHTTWCRGLAWVFYSTLDHSLTCFLCYKWKTYS